MKTLLITGAILASVPSAFTQGTLQFGNEFRNNFGAVFFRAPVYGPDPANPATMTVGQSSLGIPAGTTSYGGPLLQGTGYTMALFAGPAGLSDPEALVPVAATSFRTAAGDVLAAGLVNTIPVTLGGILPGQTATLQIRVWDNQEGTLASWAQVLATPTAARGSTPLFQSAPLGDPMMPGNNPPVTSGWVSFSIAVVPEPAVVAIGALGLGMLFLHRRSR